MGDSSRGWRDGVTGARKLATAPQGDKGKRGSAASQIVTIGCSVLLPFCTVAQLQLPAKNVNLMFGIPGIPKSDPMGAAYLMGLSLFPYVASAGLEHTVLR